MKYLQKIFLYRFYINRNDEEQILLLCSMFSIGLMIFRVIYTGHLLFSFLAWNLFLAFVPYAISRQMKKVLLKNKWKFLMYTTGWILFVPNSFYIITDLFHLDMNKDVPLWYDLALLLSFAWSGLLFGILSVRQMEKLFEVIFNKRLGVFLIVLVMALNGFGIYIGRYLRFNSWDVLMNPMQLVQDIVYMFVHPIRNRFDWSMIICYSMLLSIMYYAFKKLAKVLH